jgi:hypothetical protein
MVVRTVTATFAALAVVLVIAAWLLVSSFPGSDTGYQVTMRPATPLSQASCRAEIRRLRMTFGDFNCSPDRARPWFEIGIRNIHDENGFPICTTTAYDGAGRRLFERGVPIQVVGGEPSGP